jgi:hypothetical protein
MTLKQMSKAAVGAAVLMVPAIAVAADPVGEHQEKAVALSEVPPAAMDGAKTVLASVSKAEVVTTKDGRTLYEFRGRNDLGKTVELYVTADGQVLGTEAPDE